MVLFIILWGNFTGAVRNWSQSSLGPHYRVLLFADDVVILASLSQHLQRALGHFAAEHKGDGMRTNTFKSDATVLNG